MGEILFWTMAVFAVLGLPPLVAILWELRRERKEADQRERQRRFEEAREERMQRSDGAPESSCSIGMWPGMFLVTWTL